jgi:hypothetical protein
MVVLAAGWARAEEHKERAFWEAPEDAKVAVKQVTGEVSLIRQGSISVVYQRDDKKAMDYEMVLPLDKNVRLAHKRSVNELQVGDTVRVTYEERSWKDDTGVERMHRQATEIQFMSLAKPQLRSG